MKGVSQIISAVLLIAVGISIASIYLGWAPQFTDDMIQNITDQTDHDLKCDNAAFRIQDAEYSLTAQELMFQVENTGTIRFSDSLNAAAFNESLILERTEIPSLEVGETRTGVIETDEKPEELRVNSIDCPDLSVTTDRIKVN